MRSPFQSSESGTSTTLAWAAISALVSARLGPPPRRQPPPPSPFHRTIGRPAGRSPRGWRRARVGARADRLPQQRRAIVPTHRAPAAPSGWRQPVASRHVWELPPRRYAQRVPMQRRAALSRNAPTVCPYRRRKRRAVTSAICTRNVASSSSDDLSRGATGVINARAYPVTVANGAQVKKWITAMRKPAAGVAL